MCLHPYSPLLSKFCLQSFHIKHLKKTKNKNVLFLSKPTQYNKYINKNLHMLVLATHTHKSN